jgi:putative membrane protein
MKVPELKSPLEKAVYVASITAIFTFLGCWVVLARSENTSAASRPMAHDELFASKAAQGGIAEVKMGELAQVKSSSEVVKRFGRRMVEDHTRAGEVLTEAARKESVALPTDLDAKDRATIDVLSKLSEADFDKAYARNMVKDHQEDLNEFASEANNGRKDEIRNFASETIPTLKEHLKMAREMRQSTLVPIATKAPVSTKAPVTKKALSHGGR